MRNKFLNKNKPAGIMMLVLGVITVVVSLTQMDELSSEKLIERILLGSAMFFWGVTLVIGKRNALPVIGAGILALVALNQIIVQQNLGYDVDMLSTFMLLLWTAGLFMLVLVMAGGILSQHEGLHKLGKAIWYLPALLIGLNLLIDFVLSLILVINYSWYYNNAYVVGVMIGSAIRAVLWILTMIFACQWAVLSEVTEKDPFHQYQTYQQPQYQPNTGLVENPSATKRSEQPQDVTEVLRRFKGLLDDGIINQEEFEAKKKQLMG